MTSWSRYVKQFTTPRTCWVQIWSCPLQRPSCPNPTCSRSVEGYSTPTNCDWQHGLHIITYAIWILKKPQPRHRTQISRTRFQIGVNALRKLDPDEDDSRESYAASKLREAERRGRGRG